MTVALFGCANANGILTADREELNKRNLEVDMTESQSNGPKSTHPARL